MLIAPTSSLSFSIGTTTIVRAPPSSDQPCGSVRCQDVIDSRMWHLLVSGPSASSAAMPVSGTSPDCAAVPRYRPPARYSARPADNWYLRKHQTAKLGVANPGGILQHGVEHGCQFARRASDDLEHISGRGLLLQANSRSSLSSRVFSMAMTAWRGEIGYQFDLLFGERAHLLSINTNCADELVLLDHRHVQQGRRRRSRLWGPQVLVATAIVSNLGHLFCCRGDGRAVVRDRREKRLLLTVSAHSGGALCSATRRNMLPFAQEHCAELRLADARRIFQHCLEDRLQFARRAEMT